MRRWFTLEDSIRGCFGKAEILTDRGTRLTDWQIKVQFQLADIVLAQKSNNNNRDGIMTGGFSTSKYSINQNQQLNTPISFSRSEICPLYWYFKKHLFWPLKTPLYSKQGVELIIYITVVCQVISYCFSEPGKFFLSEAASRRLVLNCFEPIENAKHICT